MIYTSLSELFHTYWNPQTIMINALIFSNLLGAMLLGLIVGYERTYHGRAAGMRTYGLVCMASAALTISAGMSSYWYGGDGTHAALVDPTRVIQGIVTGIGFLGAGIIMKDGLNISGLTTSASIWASSAIGILVGLGFYLSAILLTFLSAIFMMWGSKIEAILPSRPGVLVQIKFKPGILPNPDEIKKTILKCGYEVADGSFSILCNDNQTEWRFVVVSQGKKNKYPLLDLSRALNSLKDMGSFQVSHARN